MKNCVINDLEILLIKPEMIDFMKLINTELIP